MRSRQIGEPRIFNSVFTQQTVAGNIRVDKEIGGGTLDDIGIYCINAARYLFQDEPIEVFASSANNGEERFREVDEMTSAILRFPGDRLATFTVSFGAAKVSNLSGCRHKRRSAGRASLWHSRRIDILPTLRLGTLCLGL